MSLKIKPYLFPSITVAVLAYAAYRVTKQQLDSGYFMLTDSTSYLLGDPGVTAAVADLAAAVASAAEALTEARASAANEAGEVSSSPSPSASAVAVATEAATEAAPEAATEVEAVTEAASQAAQEEEIPPEFADLIKRRPEEYATVVEAFYKAYAEGRVVAMKDVIWRNYMIVR
jgi:hypothetical protein